MFDKLLTYNAHQHDPLQANDRWLISMSCPGTVFLCAPRRGFHGAAADNNLHRVQPATAPKPNCSLALTGHMA